MNYGNFKESKDLGFDDLQEMKKIHSLGWHTKRKYIEDYEGFKSDSERTFMKEHGFETRKEFEEFKSGSPQQRAVIFARNVARKTDRQHAIECYAALSMTNGYANSGGVDITQAQAESVKKMFVFYVLVVNELNEVAKIPNEEFLKEFAKKYQPQFDEFYKNNDTKVKIFKRGTDCQNEINPYIREKELLSYTDIRENK